MTSRIRALAVEYAKKLKNGQLSIAESEKWIESVLTVALTCVHCKTVGCATCWKYGRKTVGSLLSSHP